MKYFKKKIIIGSTMIGFIFIGNIFVLSSCGFSPISNNQNIIPNTPESDNKNPNIPSKPNDTNNSPSNPNLPTNPNDSNSNNNSNPNPDNSIPKPTPSPDENNKPDQENKPTEPIIPPPIPSPEVKPPVTNPEMPSIDKNSLEIEGNKSSILPSMLLNENKNDIDLSKFKKKYNTELIKNVSTKVIEIDDSKGIIEFEFNYQINNIDKKFLFKFDSLLSFSNFEKYKIYLKKDDNSNSVNLNAYEYTQKLFNTKSQNNHLTNFYKFVDDLKMQKNYLQVTNKDQEIPLTYLKFSSVEVSGWKSSWFTSSSTLSIQYKLINAYFSSYKKSKTDSNISVEYKRFPARQDPQFKIEFNSAADFILDKIDVNEKYDINQNKTAEYYWGDIKFNKAINTFLNLTNDKWIKNFISELEGSNTKYQIVLQNNENDDANIDINKNLELKIKIAINDNINDGSKHSSQYKTISVPVQKLDDDPFVYNSSDSYNNKFSFGQKVDSLEENLKKMKNDKDKILALINGKTNQIIDISSVLTSSKNLLYASLKKNMTISFNNIELQNNKEKINESYFSNDDIYIKNISYNDSSRTNPNNFKYLYNASKDVFQIEMKPTIEMSKLYTSKKVIKVDITKPGKSKSDLTNLQK